MTQNLYHALCAPFSHTFRDVRGQVALEYITGEQCVSRLNEVLGVDAWSFSVLQHGIHDQADEVWVLGQLEAFMGERRIVRQQFGSNKLRRRREDRQILDIGFDMKAAATDSLKKCAQSLGVALYLARKDAQKRPAIMR
jgi:hypothetical protein